MYKTYIDRFCEKYFIYFVVKRLRVNIKSMEIL